MRRRLEPFAASILARRFATSIQVKAFDIVLERSHCLSSLRLLYMFLLLLQGMFLFLLCSLAFLLSFNALCLFSNLLSILIFYILKSSFPLWKIFPKKSNFPRQLLKSSRSTSESRQYKKKLTILVEGSTVAPIR